MNSIFSLSSIKNEPYLTKVFSFLLDSDRAFCGFLINSIFGLKSAGKTLNIKPELSIERRRPDIVIECENFSIAIENKIAAGFTDNQISSYKSKFHHVFLIYKYLNDPEQAIFSTNSFTWYNIYSEIKRYIAQLPNDYNAINKYLLNQFILFLEEARMGIGKVDWEIKNGTKSLLNLIDQILEVFSELRSTGEIESASFIRSTYSYQGFQIKIKDNIFYIYVIYHPVLIFSYFSDEKNHAPKYIQLFKVHPELDEKDWKDSWHLGTLDIDNTHFLCLSVEKQIEAVTEFVRSSIQKF